MVKKTKTYAAECLLSKFLFMELTALGFSSCIVVLGYFYHLRTRLVTFSDIRDGHFSN